MNVNTKRCAHLGEHHAIDSRFFVSPSDVWRKLNKLLKYNEHQLTNRCLKRRLVGFFRVS